MERRVTYKGSSLSYLLVQTNRRSGIAVKVLPKNEVRVYTPRGIPLREADRFVLANFEQILKMRERLSAKLGDDSPVLPRAGAVIPVEGRERKLEILSGSGKSCIHEDSITICLADPGNEDEVRRILRGMLVRLALQRFEEALRLYAPRTGGIYHRVTVRDQKTRWGSCSSKQNLNFNWRLILAPPEVLQYVVIHELCHLKEFNHSRRFWALVAAQMPDYEAWKKWLRTHGAELQRITV